MDLFAGNFATKSVANFTPGSIPFADPSGNLSQDNSNLFWDSTNKRLAIGGGGLAPQQSLVVGGASNTAGCEFAVSSSITFQAYNRNTSAYASFFLDGASLKLRPGGSNAKCLGVDANGNVFMGNAALSTSATDGFFNIASCAGAPTGTPTAFTGNIPMVFDSTDSKLYAYISGAWKSVTFS
jgi:hypothetical protein